MPSNPVALLLLPLPSTGDLLPDTLATFSSPAELAALSCLTHLSLSELALPGPWSVEEWLQRLTALQSLQFVLQDDPATCANHGLAAGSSTAACTASTGGAAAANTGLLGTGGLSAALAAAAQAAGKSRADQQLAVAQQNLLAGLQNLSSALQQAANSGAFGRVAGANSSSGGHVHQHPHHHMSPAGPSASSSGGGAPAGNRLARTSSSTSTPDADAPAASSDAAAAATAAAAAAALRPLLPVSFSTACPGLKDLVLANLYGDRLVKATVPSRLTRLVLHLANPTPGSVNGEQLAAVVMQAADSLLCLELGLGMRFSLSGTVMRGLKRALKQLQDLTLIEGAQDHLEGLGCWCNLPRLTLVEGRCTVPLRGLYELSMRAAMGRTPGVLRYHGHARHVEELASRLGSALQELRLDSLAGLGSGYRSGGCAGGGADSGSGSGASSAATSPRTSKQRRRGPGTDSEEEDEEASAAGAGGEGCGGEAGSQPLPALAQLSSMTRLEVAGDQIGQLDTYGVLVLSSCKNLRVLNIQGREAWLSADLGVKEQLEWVAALPQLRHLRLAGVMLGRTKLSADAGGKGGSSASPTAGAGRCASGSSSGGKKGGSTGSTTSSSASSPAGSVAPVVKGLGNGLGCAVSPSGVGKAHPTGRGPLVKDPEARAAAIAKARAQEAGHGEEGDAQWQAAYAKVVSVAAMQFQDLQLKAVVGQLPAGAEKTRALAYEAAQEDAGVAVCLEELRRWLCEMLPNCRVWLD